MSIKVHIEKCSDTALFLANYHGDKQFIQDTALNQNGEEFAFKADTLLPGGLYIITGQDKQRYFDLVLNDDQKFTLKTDTLNYTAHMTVKGSKENRIFFEYINFLNSRQEEASELQREKQAAIGQEGDSIQLLIDNMGDKVKKRQAQIIRDYPNTFTAKFIRASMNLEIPDSIEKQNTYAYIQDHYFDRMDISDPEMLRTPVYHPFIMRFLDQYTYQQPDSIIHNVDWILKQARKNEETFQYLLWEFTRKYESSKIMGFDKIFVHLVNTYFNREEIDWLDQTVLKNLIERADEIRPLLLGKKAPDMVMLNPDHHPKSLYGVDHNYTLVVFWDTDCGHCKREIPKLKTFYDKHAKAYDLEVYAICTDNDLKAWREFISKNKLDWINVHSRLNLGTNYHEAYDIYSTPTFYLLDEDKRIIAKRIITEKLKQILEHEKSRPE